MSKPSLVLTLCLLTLTSAPSRADAPIVRVVEHFMIGDIPVTVSHPDPVDKHARMLLLYHGFGQPSSPQELARAFPLSGTNTVGVYVNLPLIAERQPAGGADALQELQLRDFVNGLYFRSIDQAVNEMPVIVNHVAARYRMDISSGIDLFGFSAGGSAVLFALIETRLPITSVVVVNAPLSVRQNVESWEGALHRSFNWDSASERAANRFDVIQHAHDIASRRPAPDILMMQADEDEHLALPPSQLALTALRDAYRDGHQTARVELEILKGQKHSSVFDSGEVRASAFAWLARSSKPNSERVEVVR